jgi:POT family proton-dependent oligopeptide transporter
MTATSPPPASATLFGHPTGLFTLFFAEMWERFSYYGMRALLVLYMIKGFLGYGDAEAYAVYGTYMGLVYATPFIGGILADRLLGRRRAVIIGGLLMAAGHLLMGIQNETAFFTALALLICGNGFFKPNISTMVGTLYSDGSPRRDGGFTIFYMGINLGAAMSPLICGSIGETYGWHYGFGLATFGMLVGLAVFVAPIRLTQILILSGALGTSIALLFMPGLSKLQLLTMNAPVAVALVASGIIACVALARGGLPPEAGAPPDLGALKRKVAGALRTDYAVYLGVVIAIPIFALLVQRNQIAGWLLFLFGGAAMISLVAVALRSQTIERQRLFVILILMFYSMLFWSFFEQAGSSVNNFTDRNVDRVFEDRTIEASEIGSTITIELNQEQLGHRLGDRLIVLGDVDAARASGNAEVKWLVGEADVGMGVGGSEIKTTIFQAANPIFILVFGLALTGLWAFLGPRGWEPRTPVKFALGLLQLGLGFGAFWYGAHSADSRGMVAMSWLLIGYLLQTTGELCLSPVGLSMVTMLSPKRIVSTVMGAWFLAMAFSGYLAGTIAGFTGVEHEAGGSNGIPPPIETVGIYGDVFGKIAIAAIVSAVSLFALAPLLNRWTHSDIEKSTE